MHATASHAAYASDAQTNLEAFSLGDVRKLPEQRTQSAHEDDDLDDSDDADGEGG